MEHFGSFPGCEQENLQDLLQSAPCPPPLITYKEFRKYAFHCNLSQAEVCSITEKCKSKYPDLEQDCFVWFATTGTTMCPLNITTNTISSTDQTTQFSGEDETFPWNLIVIFIASVLTLVIIVAIVICRRKRQNKDKIKRKRTPESRTYEMEIRKPLNDSFQTIDKP